jgi:hypothetical protein
MTKSLLRDEEILLWGVGTRLVEAATEKDLPAQAHLAQDEELPAQEIKLRRSMVSYLLYSCLYFHWWKF